MKMKMKILYLFMLFLCLFACRTGERNRPDGSSSEPQTMTSEEYRNQVLKTLKGMSDIKILLGAQNNQAAHDYTHFDLCLDNKKKHKDILEDPKHKPLMLKNFDFNKMDHVGELDFLKGKVESLVFDVSTSKFWEFALGKWLPLLKKGGTFYIEDPPFGSYILLNYNTQTRQVGVIPQASEYYRVDQDKLSFELYKTEGRFLNKHCSIPNFVCTFAEKGLQSALLGFHSPFKIFFLIFSKL